jgi:hypothetical protein
MDGVRKCIVDDNVILNRTRPLLMTERGDTAETAA